MEKTLALIKSNRMRVALSFLLSVLMLLSVSGLLDTQAQRLAEKGFTRALVAFAAARGLNGVISVAQGTEFALQPAGIGVNFAPGQILDPINDLVERFSWVMLAASTSLGLQQLLLVIFSSRIFSFAVGALFLIAAYLLWRTKKLTEVNRQRVIRAALFILVLRFGIVVLTLGSELVFETFLTERYDAAYSQLQNGTSKIDTLNKSEQKASKAKNSSSSSWIDAIRGQASQLSATFDLSAKMDKYKALAEELSRSTVELVVIFLFQTILLPLAFLSLFISLTKSILR